MEDSLFKNIKYDLEDIVSSNTKQTNILVYCLTFSIDNNKILILSDKINKNNFCNENFDVIYKTNINDTLTLDNELLENEYSFIFSEKKIYNSKYVFKTYFNLSKNNKIEPYRYYPAKFFNNYHINTKINLNIDDFYAIPDNIYESTKKCSSSKIIWSPSWDNINNDHFLIRKINEIGYNFYGRKNNLIDVVASNDEEKIKNFSNCTKNDSNICIYQETLHNPLNMSKCVYMQWFFDAFNILDLQGKDSLYLYQFPMYSWCSNILRMRYSLPIDINCTNIYPNSLPLIFNINIIENIINNTNKNKTIESCYLLRKAADSHPLKMMDSVSDFYIHPGDSINLDSNSLEENISMFIKCKKFYCYDNVCFLPVLAALCNCTPILVNKYNGFENIKDMYKTYSPWMYYGIAYDDTEEELNFAKNTKHLLIDLLRKIDNDNFLNFFSDKGGNIQLLNFLKYLECYFGVSFHE